MKKQRKKRRLKVGRLFFLLLILSVISFAFLKVDDIKIMSIVIKGNNILTDQEIIEMADLDDYPSFFTTLSYNVKKKILESKYVEDVRVSKGILRIKINVIEKKVLYIDSKTENKVTDTGEINDEKIVCAPYLINEVPEDKKLSFVKAMKKIDDDILCQMSEIKYDPNEIDKDRYYVYMNDGNSVYLTVNKFEKINKYNTILENVGKQNGTLYLDYGDYFEVK